YKMSKVIKKNKQMSVSLQVNPVSAKRINKKTNGHANGVKLSKNSRSFETRLIPRYDAIPPMPQNFIEPHFSESSEKILRERYLLKGGNLEVVETIAERFWHTAYDIASAEFD